MIALLKQFNQLSSRWSCKTSHEVTYAHN